MSRHPLPSFVLSPLLTSLGVLLNLPMVAVAQHGHSTITKLPPVEISAQRAAERTRQSSPMQIQVIPEEDVERYGDATVGDVLRRLPGVSFTGPAGVVKDARIRGLDKGYTQFLINGEPVPTGSKERQLQVDRLPADMIERIEIIHNPGASQSADGIGGTINIVLKEGADELTRLRASAGRNGALHVNDVVAQWSRRFGDTHLLLAASHTIGAEDVQETKHTFDKTTGALSATERKARPTEKSETLLAPRLVWRSGQNKLTVDPFVSWGTEDKHEDSTTLNATERRTKSSTAQENKKDQIARLSAKFERQTAWGHWQVKGGTQRGASDKDKDTQAYEYNAGTGAITKTTLGEELERIDERHRYLGTSATWLLGEHTLAAGLEAQAARFDTSKTKLENGADKSSAKERFLIEEARQVVWLQDTWRMTPRQTLTPGWRFERFERDTQDSLGNPGQGEHRISVPSLHYAWQLGKRNTVRASVARTVRLPKFDELNPYVTLDSGNSLSRPDKGGNPALRPQKALGFELGIDHFFKKHRGVLGANVYDRRVEDHVEKIVGIENGRFVERPANVGKAHFWGLELDWRVPLWHRKGHEWTLTGSHAELRGNVSNQKLGGKQGVKDLPPRISNLGMDWSHRPSGWSAGFALNWQPSFTTDSLNDDGAREIKQRNASTMLDLNLVKRIGMLTELRFIAKNVLSVEKSEQMRKYDAAGAVTASEAKTERSRPTVFLTFETRF